VIEETGIRMRRTGTFALITVLALCVPAGAFAAGRPAARQSQGGTVSGEAKDATGQKLATKIRVRNASTGEISAEVTSDATGAFTATGLPAGSYVVEVLGTNGAVIGVSPAISGAAGSTVSVSVTATAVGSVSAASTTGGFSLFGLGAGGSAVIIGAAVVAAVAGVVAVKGDASPSK